MAIFTNGQPFTNLGYQTLFRQQLRAAPIPFDDPRGLLRPGMTPTKALSYRVFAETSNFIQLSGPLNDQITAGRADVALGRSRVWASVIAFEGKDVIDLPTDDLTKDGNNVVVPDYIFRVLHAGADKFIRTPDESVQQRSIEEYIKPTTGNVSLGVVVNDDRPDDLKRLGDQSWRTTDMSSKTIRTRGGAKYVSYVAATRPVFRDVVYQRVSYAATVIIGFGSLIPIDVGVTATDFFVIRYAWVNVAPPDSPPRFQWRMSESFNTKTAKTPVKAPPAIVARLSKTQATKEVLAELHKHYVYDLNEPGDDLATSDPYIPAKTPYSPAAARAKMDSSTSIFDENFSSKVVDYDSFLFAPSGVEEPYSAGLQAGSNNIFVAQAYTSPRLLVDMGQDARLGMEYIGHQPQFLNILPPPQSALLLAKTVESTFGITAVEDCCLNTSTVFDVVDSPAGSIATERTYDDESWTKVINSPPDSNLKQFMLGEFPNRSVGKPILVPPPSKLDITSSGSGLTLPQNTYATLLKLSVSTPSNNSSGLGVFALHPEATPGKDPVFEAAHPPNGSFGAVDNPTFMMGVPALNFANAETGGGFALEEAWGVQKDQSMLEAMKGDPQSSDPTEVQFSQVKELKFPLQANNLSAATDCTTGWTFIAMEDGERIDLGVRPNAITPFGLLRDVTLRIPEPTANTSSNTTDVTLPAATMPFLVADTQTHNLMLFYVYKGNLLVKRMPSELLVKEPVYNNLRPFSLETEMKLVRMAHGCKAALVLDPSGGTGNGLGADLTAGVVKVVQGDPNPYPKPASGKRKQIAQYSAFLDRSGYLYAFVQAEDRISVARSHDVGDSWMNVLPEDFSFIPKNPNSTSTDRVDGEAPFCFYDAATDNLLVFFFYHSCLVFIKAPVSVFRDAPEAAGEALAKMKPMILVGQANKDMADRGFTAAKSVEDIKTGETPPVLSPHRVAAIKTVQGYYRVFYKDDKKKLKSLISTDNGGTWMTERQSLERQQ